MRTIVLLSTLLFALALPCGTQPLAAGNEKKPPSKKFVWKAASDEKAKRVEAEKLSERRLKRKYPEVVEDFCKRGPTCLPELKEWGIQGWVADLDQDGSLDLLVYETQTLVIYRNGGGYLYGDSGNFCCSGVFGSVSISRNHLGPVVVIVRQTVGREDEWDDQWTEYLYYDRTERKWSKFRGDK